MRCRAALAGLLCVFALRAAAEVYRVTVSRVDQDLYKDVDSGTIIETQYCYHYCTRDNAILRWEGRYGNSKLIFSDDSSCTVKGLR